MKRVLVVFFQMFSLYLFISALSISVSGQTYQTFRSELEQITERARWRLGPLRIFPSLQFRNIGYDDNVYFDRAEDNPISDYTATVSAQLRAYLLFGDWLILSFTESPGYLHFAKEKNQRAFYNGYSPGFKLLVFNSFVISGDYNYRKARRRASREFNILVEERVEGYNGRFFYETARRTTFGVSGKIRNISYEEITQSGQEIPFSSALNREEKGGDFEFYYRIFSESSFFLNVGYRENTFESIESQWRNSYSYQAYSGIRFPLFGRARGILSLGYKKLFPKSGEKQGFSGLVGNTSLDFRLGRFGFRFQYEKDSQFSIDAENIYFIDESYGAGISFFLTQFLRLDYNFNYSEANYPELIPLIQPDGSYEEMKRRDIYRTQSVGFVIRVIRNIGLGLMLNFWERESNFLGASRNRMLIGGYLTYEF